MSHYDEFEKSEIKNKQGGNIENKMLWVLYEKIELIRLKASKTINPLVKAKMAEQAIELSLELTKGLLIKIERLEGGGRNE